MHKRLFCFIGALIIVSISIAQQSSVFKTADSLFLAQNYSKAKTEYEHLLKANLAPPLTWNRLAFSCYQLGKFDEAIAHFEKAISMNPPDQLKNIILIRMAKSYGAKKDKFNALLHLRKSVEAGFANLTDIKNDPNLLFLKTEPGYAAVMDILNQKLNPCLGNPKNRELDFWIGEWNVFNAKTNRPEGTNSIQMGAGGCMLLENWTDITETSTAKSMTFLNPDNGKWEQVYIDNGGKRVLKFTNGALSGDVMKFSILTKGEDGKDQVGELVFEKKTNGEVRQYQQTTPDGGKTWNIVFDLIYRRKGN